MAIRVLIIDPDIPFLVRIKQALDDSSRFNVSISANGLAAEDALHHHRHDIAVLDFSVPDMDTVAIIKQLRHIQSNLAVIVTPESESQITQAQDLTVQGVLPKPYAARDLMALIQRIIPKDPRAEVDEDEDEDATILDVFAPPEMPPGLRHLMEPPAEPHSPTELLDHVERTMLSDVDAAPPTEGEWSRVTDEMAGMWDEAEADQPEYEGETGGTRIFDQPGPDPNATDILAAPDELDPTMRLAETETLDDLMLEQGWLGTGPNAGGRGFGIEPPIDPEDTPTVPNQDLDSIRQFLATDHQGHFSSEFGEVLDAVAQSSPVNEPKRSTSDREFHDLVESLRMTEEQGAARNPLDALLSAMAAEQAAHEPGDDTGATSGALDYLLNAIRHDEHSGESGATASGAGMETIGEVMSGLFDPSFEGVLAALAGEEIDDIDETGDSIAALGLDDVSLDDLRAEAQGAAFEDLLNDEDPAWLADYQPGGILPDTPEISYLPPQAGDADEDDAATYPATQALNAVSSAESSEFSLDALLSEIERHIPQSQTPRPQLKPLPSWNKGGASSPLGDQAPGESVPPPDDEMFGSFSQETRPSRSVMDEWGLPAGAPEVPAAEPVAPPDEIAPPPDITPPAWAGDAVAEAGKPAMEPPMLDAYQFSEPLTAEERDEIDAAFDSFTDLDMELPTAMEPPTVGPSIEPQAEPFEAYDQPAPTSEEEAAFEAFFADEAEFAPAEPPAESQTAPFDGYDASQPALTDEDAAFEAFFAAAPEPARPTHGPDEDLAEIFEGLLEDAEAAFRPPAPEEPEQPPEAAAEQPPTYEAAGEQDAWAWDQAPASETDWLRREALGAEAYDEYDSEEASQEPEPYSLEAVDADTFFAPDMFEGDTEEDARLAHAAVELTRFALESSAQAVLLTRGGQRLAEAGDMPVIAMDRLYEMVITAWQTSSTTLPTLMRYIRLPDMGEFMLYSTVIEDDLILSMIFHAGMSIHATRRLAQRISTSLASVPDSAPAAFDEAHDEPPTERIEPEEPEAEALSADELREAAEQALEQAAAHHAPGETGSAVVAPQPEQPTTAYTCFWLVADPSRIALEGDLLEDLRNWIGEVAGENGWDVPALEIGPDSILLSINIPQKTLPDAAVTIFMDETASAAAAYYPEMMDASGQFWADGYYVITPPRELTDREMARFAAYQYQR
ncbi:MAG TPA: response regulator [Aggregatilinea sp.]|uniref:response regulator n=1 Tax=Aggregatilinea sp. TaxID=2806333 RepID=UPI002C08C327|nr:response regulator [Aggregatilinea sp.]HML23144.1 response regulator [Aggregatilinea sp.]